MSFQLHQSLSAFPPAARGCVLTVGNFDGVHRGHAHLVAAAGDVARREGAPLGVMTFEPHPREFFQPDAPPFRLTLLPMKARRLQGLGVDHLFAVPFDQAFAALEAEDFIRLLTETLAVRHVVVGQDFAFGRGRTGNVDSLRAHVDVTVANPLRCADGVVMSSTRIRGFIGAGDMDAAAEMLGWRWQMESEVVHGDKRGRELGYPTANQLPGRHAPPRFGIYAVRAQVEGEDTWRDGVASFGIRPMFRLAQPVLETHLFDFSGDLYGKALRVMPLAYLRGEMGFDGIEALVAQIERDCHDVRAVLESPKFNDQPHESVLRAV